MKTKQYVIFQPHYLILFFFLILMDFSIGPIQAQENEELGEVYIIQNSDTLWNLAEKYLGDGNHYPLIISATNDKAAHDSTFSPITDTTILHPGQKIWIPASEGLPALAQSTPVFKRTKRIATPVSSTPTAMSDSSTSLSSSTPQGQIAFSFWNDSPNRCTYEINIISVPNCLESEEQCQATRRIIPLNNISEPALSPTGERLAFRGWGPIPDEIENGRRHPYAGCPQSELGRWLHSTSLDGTEERTLTHFWEDSHPDWSPDGTRILFDSGRNGDGIIRLLFVYADGSGEEAEELQIAGQQPSWASDNQRLVYRGCDPTGNRCGLWLAEATPLKPWDSGANIIGPLVEDPSAAHPDWSPNSEEIVYQSTEAENGDWNLYRIKADGTEKKQLTSADTVEGSPTWSPDGKWIAYLSNAEGNWGIWIMPADGNNSPQRLFTFDGGQFTPHPVIPYGSRDWVDEQISWSQK